MRARTWSARPSGRLISRPAIVGAWRRPMMSGPWTSTSSSIWAPAPAAASARAWSRSRRERTSLRNATLYAPDHTPQGIAWHDHQAVERQQFLDAEPSEPEAIENRQRPRIERVAAEFVTRKPRALETSTRAPRARAPWVAKTPRSPAWHSQSGHQSSCSGTSHLRRALRARLARWQALGGFTRPAHLGGGATWLLFQLFA